jgi:hypothetical protein
MDHMQDIDEANSEKTDGTNPALRHEAAKVLPTLQMHLNMSRRALSASQGMRG